MTGTINVEFDTQDNGNEKVLTITTTSTLTELAEEEVPEEEAEKGTTMRIMGELIELVPIGKYHHGYDYGYEYVNESHTEEEKKKLLR